LRDGRGGRETTYLIKDKGSSHAAPSEEGGLKHFGDGIEVGDLITRLGGATVEVRRAVTGTGSPALTAAGHGARHRIETRHRRQTRDSGPGGSDLV